MFSKAQLVNLGKQLGEYALKYSGNKLTSSALQAVVADLTSGMPDLQAPLRDLVTRQSFQSLLPKARSGGGMIQRDALIQEIKCIYQQDIAANLEEVLNGFLDIPESIASSSSSPPTAYGLQKGKPPLSITSNSAGNTAVTLSSSVPSYYNSPQPKSPKIVRSALGIAVAFIAIMGLFFAVRNQKVMQIPVEKPIQEIDSLKDSQLNELADEIFWRRHPYLKGKKLTQQNSNLAREWIQIRECEAIVDYEFYKIYPYMRGRLIQENQVEMSSAWKELYDQNSGCQ